MSLSTSFVLPTVLALLFSVEKTAVAEEEESALRGQIGFSVAGRSFLGEIGEQYSGGVLLGVRAGVDVGFDDSDWRIGGELSSMVRGFYFSAEEESAKVSEFSLSLKMRRRLSEYPHFIFLGVGGVFGASNVPLPPGNERRYLGGQAALGYERVVTGHWLWAVETSAVHYFGGPQSISLSVSMLRSF